MSLGWVITGTVGQLMFGYFLFMLVVFSGAGIANGNTLSELQLGILRFSMYALPLSCILSAGIVLCLYKTGANSLSYWWYTLPLILAFLYTVFALRLSS